MLRRKIIFSKGRRGLPFHKKIETFAIDFDEHFPLYLLT
jgi:hypothetical protein